MRAFARPLRAFSLVELLVVIVIIALLAVIGFPAYRKFVQDSQFSTSIVRMRAIASAIQSSAADNNGRFPILHRGWQIPTTWVHQIAPYLGVQNVDVSREPFNDPLETGHHPRLGDFAANSLVLLPKTDTSPGLSMAAVLRPAQTILVSMGRESNNGGRGTWYFYGKEFAANPRGNHVAQPSDRGTGKIAFVHVDGSAMTMAWEDFLQNAKELLADPTKPQP